MGETEPRRRCAPTQRHMAVERQRLNLTGRLCRTQPLCCGRPLRLRGKSPGLSKAFEMCLPHQEQRPWVLIFVYPINISWREIFTYTLHYPQELENRGLPSASPLRPRRGGICCLLQEILLGSPKLSDSTSWINREHFRAAPSY